MCRSRLRMNSRFMPRRSARDLMQVKAACADSCISRRAFRLSVRRRRLPVLPRSEGLRPRPLSRQAQLQANLALCAMRCWRNLIGPSISRTRSAVKTSLKLRRLSQKPTSSDLARAGADLAFKLRRLPLGIVSNDLEIPSSVKSSCSGFNHLLLPVSRRDDGRNLKLFAFVYPESRIISTGPAVRVESYVNVLQLQ